MAAVKIWKSLHSDLETKSLTKIIVILLQYIRFLSTAWPGYTGWYLLMYYTSKAMQMNMEVTVAECN